MAGFEAVSYTHLDVYKRQHQGYRILALKRDGGGRDPELNVRLEKRLAPFRGQVDEDE